MRYAERAETALRQAWQERVGRLGLRELVIALIVLLPLSVYLVGLRYLGSWDTFPNEVLPISILRDHDLALGEFAADPDHLPYFLTHGRGGRIVSLFPIVPGLMQVPVYAAAVLMGVNPAQHRRLLSLISSSTITALSVLFMYLCLRRVLRRELPAIAFALIYAFGTAAWSVTSRGIWQHGPALLFITAALYLILTADTRLVAGSGFFLGMAVWNRPSNALLALPLAVYVAYKHRRSVPGFVGLGAIPILLMSLYSYAYFGSVAALGQGQPIGGLTGRIGPALLGLLFSPNRGLLVFSPILLPALLYLPYALFARAAPALHRALAIALVAFVLLASKWPMWWGGWCFGYRLLIETLPFLMVFLAVVWDRVIRQRPWAVAVFALLVAASAYIHFLGAFVYPSGFDRTIGITTPFSQEVPPNARLGRLWVVRDSELARCTARLFGRGQ